MGRARHARREGDSRSMNSASRLSAWRRALGAAALLAAAAVATALPPAAQAQTATKLVGNTGQQSTGTGSFSQGDMAQAFTTGSHAGGYRLTRVDFQIWDGTTTAPTYRVEIYTESSGRPASRMTTLTNPGSLPRGNNQLARFTHSGGGVNLAANTTYFAVIAISNSGSGGNVGVGFTSSDDEDSGAATGWSIANGSLWAGNISTGTWSTSTNARQIAVYGYAKTAQTPTPTRLKADSQAANTIRLTWSYGRPRPDLFVIEVSTDGGGTWTQLATKAGDLSSWYEHTGLAGGTVRHYRVKARNSVGGVNRDSAWSNTALATALHANAPAKPAGFQAKAADNGVLLSWNDPNDAAVTGYEYQQAEGDTFGTWKAIPGSGPRTTSHRVTGLTAGADYSFRLRAVKGAIKGLPSGGALARAGAVVPLPEKADLLSATGSTSGSGIVTLSWNRAFVHTDGKRAYDKTILKYQVEVRRRTDTSRTWVDIPDSDYRTTSHHVGGLQNGVEYVFRIRAVNASGAGDFSDELAATPRWPADMVLKHGVRLANLSITPGDDSLKVAWRKLEGRTYCGYIVGWREGGTGDWQQYAFTSPLHRVKTTITGLKPGTSYQVRVSVNSGYENVPNGVAWERTVSTTGTSMAPPITASGPALELARVRGAEMALRFDAALDDSSVPAASAFAVSVAGSARSVSSVSVSRFLVTLTLASAVTSGQAVTVGYTPPSTGKLRARGGGPAVAAFSGEAVANDTPSQQRRAALPALTASVLQMPSEHRGKGRFVLRIVFSEAVAGTARAAEKTIRVTGGMLTRARRAGGADRWALELQPSGHGEVAVTLPASADCAASGAVCTADGRGLQFAVTYIVPGPPALSVADARAQEGPDATVDFAVKLSRAAGAPVTVDWRTRNGTAKAGKDYTRARGTLTFAAGETSKTVSVALIDDAHDEGTETFLLKLSNAGGAVIADGEATGTIENSDPLQRAWLARFGRAAAADAVAAVTARLETPRDAGSHLTLAGQRLSGDGAALAQAVTGLARAFGAREAPPADDPFASHGLSNAWNGPVSAPGRAMTGRELLMGTSFRAVLGQGAGSRFTGWGQGASVSRFTGAAPGLSLSGETATGAMGMDYGRGRLLTGLAMTHSLGEGEAQGAGRSYAMGSSVTTVLPYARFEFSERVSAWSLVGTGSGRLTLDLEGGAEERYGTDLSMTLAAAGVRGEILTAAQAGGFALALKADAFWVRTESDAVSAPEVGNLAAARADATRFRAVLDGSRTFSFAGGGTLTPSVALGLRHDGGDAETGTGVELSAGVGYADPLRGLDMALRVHGLAGHAEEGYSEWGVSGSLRLVPGVSGRGLSVSLTPSWGVDPGGSERLWAMPDASGLAAYGNAAPASRLDTEVGYGVRGPAGLGVVTPYAGLGLSDGGSRAWRAGARWQVAPGFALGLEGTRNESGGDPAEHGLMLRGAVRW